jgi:CubicO group peptidase (beta-lactamase class C family)
VLLKTSALSGGTMSGLKVEVEPDEVGFDRERLARIDRHFERYVDDGRLPGWLLAVSRDGKIAHLTTYGHRDLETRAPVELDTLFRMYSMTKPITSVAAMMLYEEGAFELKDPVHRFIPSFRDVRVYRSGSALNAATEPATEPVRIWHLLTHMSGLTYGFHHAHPVDEMYRARGFEWGSPPDTDLEACCDAWADMPLLFQPGTEWNYGVSTDVLGRVVEVASGTTLDEFFRTRIFEPLGMVDSMWFVEEAERDRLASLYLPGPGRKAVDGGAFGKAALRRPPFLSGGGGLISTASDYHRFAQMLLHRGALDGVRLLSPRTVDYMTQNHLPGGVDLEAIGRPVFAETTYDGIGFGLGFSVLEDPAKNKVLSSKGEYGWGGAASTAFWIDPAERITVLFLTQLLPSTTHPIRPQLRQLVRQALVD